jgi:mRNA interferase RelE/StbE
VVVSPDAQAFFELASAILQKKSDRCFEQLKVTPRQHPNIKSLKGNFAGYFRYRVGDYCVIYQINDNLHRVEILLIDHRSKIYE